MTVASPGLEKSAAVMVAVKVRTLLLASSVMFVMQAAVEAPELVLRGQVLPFHCTFVWGTKPLPVSVNVKLGQDCDVDTQVEAGI